MERIIHCEQDSDHPVVIGEEGHTRSLRFGTGASQSCMNLLAPHRLQLAYTRWMMTALLLHPAPDRFLILGLGGGSLVRFLRHYHPGAQIDAVEKSATVIRLARAYFQIPGCDSRLRLLHLDAESFLRQHPGQRKPPYHIVFLDIFGPDCMAPPVFDPAFHDRIMATLTSDGVMAVNLWSGDRKRFLLAHRAIQDACKGRMLKLQVRKRSNVIMLAFPGQLPRTRLRQVRKNVRPFQERYQLNFARYLKRLRRGNRSFLTALVGRA